MTDDASPRRMLVIDTAYTHDMIKQRGLEDFVTCRDLGGYFDHVWSVHPFASLLVPKGHAGRSGRPATYAISSRHSLVEGKVGRFRALEWLAVPNFLIAQIGLLDSLSKLVRRERIGLVRAEDPYYNGLIAWLLSRIHRVPLLIGVWGNPGAIRAGTGRPIMPRLHRRVWIEEAIERFVLRRADLVLVQNENNRAFVISSGVPRERTAIFVMGNMIHPAHFIDPSDRASGLDDLRQLTFDADDKVISCIARLIPEKMLDDAVRSVAWLKERGTLVHLLFVGDGGDRDNLANLASELGVSSQIVFAGNRDQEWLARVIPALDSVVSPISGRALTEAGLGAAPIVAYDVDWQGEIIRTGETGELVACGDWEQMARAISRLIDDPAYARGLGSRVRAELMEMMDPEKADRAQAEVYDRLLNPRDRAGRE
jgi:glycosyltransferase involved in cell wall biosynthesis